MVTGKVVRFDGSRGYGFVRPDTGGDDVFLHANDLVVNEQFVAPGVQVEFEVEEGDRGLKASRVRLAEGARTAAPRVSSGGGDGEDDGDVLDPREFNAEVTEILLTAAPGITAEQIVRIRQRLTDYADEHGWIAE